MQAICGLTPSVAESRKADPLASLLAGWGQAGMALLDVRGGESGLASTSCLTPSRGSPLQPMDWLPAASDTMSRWSLSLKTQLCPVTPAAPGPQ